MKSNTQPPKNESLIIAIYADDKKGLLAQILMIFNRRNVVIYDLTVSRTDIQPIVLITIEVDLSHHEAQNINHKIQNIIEVHKVFAYPGKDLKINKIALFKLSHNCRHSGLLPALQKYGAVITEIHDDSFIVQKIGPENELGELYRFLDGEFLVSYCKSSMVTSQSLIPLDVLFQEA
jgi:acetolactate synthase-1/3 small subunit